MLTVQRVEPPKPAGEKKQEREYSRTEKQSKGFLAAFLEATDERIKNESETNHLYHDSISGIDPRRGAD